MIGRLASAFVLLAILAGSAYAQPPPSPALLPATPERPTVFSREVDRRGGEGTGLALAAVRLGNRKGFERLVLEFAGGGKDAALPVFTARSETYPERLVIDLAGVASRAGTAALSYQDLRRSLLLSGVSFLSTCGGGVTAVVLTARPVKYALSELRNPSRMVIDLSSADIPPLPDLRYSLQSLPLEGDAACLFLEMASVEKGSPARLLATASGRMVGEAGIYDTPEAARLALRGFPLLQESFSLSIKARGPLDVPQD
jgi:hypothetical protein